MPLGSGARHQLMEYLSLLQKWNAVYNLTAVRDPESMLRLHLLDSLAAWAPVRHRLQLSAGPRGTRAARVADVGSGAGLPGLVWAIAEQASRVSHGPQQPHQPQQPQGPQELEDVQSEPVPRAAPAQPDLPPVRFTLIDAVEKKTAFQRQAVAQLGLGATVECLHARVEEAGRDSAFDLVASRAFASLRDFVTLTSGLLAAGGKWAALKGAVPHEEIAALPRWAVVEDIVPLDVPMLDGAARCVVLLRRDVDQDRAED